MKKKSNLYFLILLLLFFSCTREKYKTKEYNDSNGYKYESVNNDPANTRIYTLANGLKVYLSVNTNEPRIMTLIGVRAGSTSEPESTTGLAHYFEHLMFKGTSSYGTADWNSEKPLLDSISNLFEKYRKETNEQKRKEIYSRIDKFSIQASKYAIPNEYDKMTSEIGARYTNAFTSYDRTAYINDIPSNELRRWLALEYNRFGDIALRLFHTELETVYEEFNMYQDRDEVKADNAFQKAMYSKSPLGRDVIGYPEHLKNPSMVNILNFKKTWYVPNNMAICLSGDFDFEKTIKMVDETFGQMKSQTLPVIDKIEEDPIAEPIVRDVYGPETESLAIGYRCNGALSSDKKMVYIIGQILHNEKAGLFDIDLLQEQKVHDASAYTSFYRDYGNLAINVTPKNDQTLDQAKDVVLEEIEKLKKGDFPDWMPSAIANQYRLSMLRNFQVNWKVFNFLNAFILNQNWNDILSYADELEKVSKAQVVDFANQFFKNNYILVFKRKGQAKDLVKVPKPPLTPITINRNDHSKFYTEWVKIPVDTIAPVFVDFSTSIKSKTIQAGVELGCIHNNDNELFSNYYIIDAGKSNNQQIPLALNYLPYIGTKKHTATELKQELFRYGLSTFVQSQNNRSWVYVSGLNRNFRKGIELMEEMITEATPDTSVYKKYAERIIKERNDAKLNQDNILWEGLWNYAKYGKKSPFNDVLSDEQIRKSNPEEFTNLTKELFTYPHRIFYYGPSSLDEVASVVKEYHKLPSALKPLPEKKIYPEIETGGENVLLADYDMSQINLILYSKGAPFSQDVYINSQLFNQYFGNSMSSIVFQEIREAQGMAYSAYIGYGIPEFKEKPFYLMGFIGTQTDKLKMATSTMERLLSKLIENQNSLDVSLKAIRNTIATERIQNQNLYFTWLNNQDLGIDHDIRKDFYAIAETATMKDLQAFFDSYIKNKPFTYLIVGNVKDIDQKYLKEMGNVKQLSLEELFGY